MPSDDEVVQTAAAAAENVIFSRFSNSEVTDVDVTVTFEDQILEVDVYVNAPEGGADADQVADDAALAARAAVDDLFADES
jgi:phage-related tail fiber protein